MSDGGIKDGVSLPKENFFSEIQQHLSGIQIHSKFPPDAKWGNYNLITDGPEKITDPDQYLTFSVTFKAGKPVSVESSRPLIELSQREKILKVKKRTESDSAEMQRTIFLERAAIGDKEIWVFYLTPQSNQHLGDQRARTHSPNAEIVFQMDRQGGNTCINYLRANRHDMPGAVLHLFQKFMPNLVNTVEDRGNLGIVVQKPNTLVIVNETFEPQLMGEPYLQSDPDSIFRTKIS